MSALFYKRNEGEPLFEVFFMIVFFCFFQFFECYFFDAFLNYNYESQLRLLDNQIDYSTVHVEIFEVERMTDAGDKGFFEEIKERFGDNLYKVGHGFRNLIIGILGALPILIVCAAVIAVIVVIVKKSIKKI